jgi:3-oxoacyl-[acyl-carrier-protein] synthase III
MRYAEITGWGKALPPVVLTNSDLEKIVETSDDWITSRSGIKERRISHVEVSEMSAVAANHALAAAGLEANDIDLMICATLSPETLVPPTSALIQARLGANRMGAFDLNANCSGFVYGMVAASDMIRGGTVNRVLVIGAEKMSYVMDYTDRTTCVLFGDGAGAVVMEATDEPVGILASELGVDGTAAPFLCVPEFGSVGAPGPRDPRKAGVYMEGQEVFRRAVTKLGEASVSVVERAGWTIDDVDLLIPHQANLRIIDATARRLGLDASKVFVNVASYGNTSAATIPVALTEAVEAGRIRPGANLVFAAFGGGLTWAAASMKWGSRVEPIGTSDDRIPGTDQTVWDLLAPHFEYFGRVVTPDE